tara:strand:- start:157 stop:1476 length:1320 start_codon:yes stop_codon:yes gene_type:complete
MASTYIYRDNDATAGGGYTSTWTWSAWVKRGTLGEQGLFMNRRIDHVSNSRMRFYFSSDGRLAMEVKDSTSGDDSFFQTNKLFRDTSAWYNIVLAYDTTQSAENDRIKLWINNEEVTSWEQFNRAGSTFGMLFSSATRSMLGIATNNSNTDFMFDGSMSHVHFIYGTAYTPSAFGETDATTGEWKIKTDVSVTYGSQGFFVLKDGNSATDQSGQSNNMTIAGGTLTKTEDCPSNVFATLNPLDTHHSDTNTFANGNTSITTNSNGSRSTLAVESGKFYAEIKIPNTTCFLGVQDQSKSVNGNDKLIQLYTAGATLYIDGSNQGSGGYGSGWASNDIMRIALDLTSATKKVYYGKNGGWWNGTDYSATSPTTGINLDNNMTYAFSSRSGSGSPTAHWNFGNGYFGTTAVSSAGTNASNNGIFEYDVPTGYTALSTKGLNL